MSKNIYLRITLNLLTILSVSIAVQASHILGSTMSYKCLGDNNYLITLEIYKDNLPGNPDFDLESIIGVYKCDKNVSCKSLTKADVFLTAIAALDTSYEIEPPVYPAGKAYELFPAVKGIYHFTITLPQSDEPYFIVHQRYSNDQTIMNVSDKGFFGFTTMIELTPEANLLCNTSPVFNESPITELCLETELYYDYGAHEPDGDSLGYSFFDPLGYYSYQPDSTICESVFPEPLCPPPYVEVEYQQNSTTEKPFGLFTDVQDFDSNGKFHIIPKYLLGSYINGMKVSEYRNGKMLSTTFRTMITQVFICSWTNTKSKALQESVKIVPNPNSGEFSIYASDIIDIHNAEIYNFQGNMVQKIEKIQSLTYVSHLASGIYWVKLSYGENQFIIKKLTRL